MSTPESDEVRQHRELLESEDAASQEEARKAAEDVARADEEHLARNQAELAERIRAAKEFAWDAWEEETGLTRPAIEE
jgi:hypothetical protein